jgi:hypothetical protein
MVRPYVSRRGHPFARALRARTRPGAIARPLTLVVMAALLLSPTAVSAASAPPNDEPSGATQLTPGVSLDFDSSDATESASDPTDCDGSNGSFPGPYYASVWFSYTATAGDRILYVDAPTTQGDPNDFLAITFVFAKTNGGLQLIDCRAYGNDASWLATPGTTYLIMEAGLDCSVTADRGDPDCALSNRGGHGTITLFQVQGRTLTRSFEFSDTFDFGCPNVNLTETFLVTDRVTLLFAANGAILRVDDHVFFTGTITNLDTGQTYRDPGHFLNRFDVQTGMFTQYGLIFNITIPGQGVVALDVGLISFDPSGNVVIHGPHQVFEGLDLCEVLA